MKTAIDEAKCRHSVLCPVKLYKTQTEGSSAPSSVPYPYVAKSLQKVFGKCFGQSDLLPGWHGKTFHVLVLM